MQWFRRESDRRDRTPRRQCGRKGDRECRRNWISAMTAESTRMRNLTHRPGGTSPWRPRRIDLRALWGGGGRGTMQCRHHRLVYGSGPYAPSGGSAPPGATAFATITSMIYNHDGGINGVKITLRAVRDRVQHKASGTECYAKLKTKGADWCLADRIRSRPGGTYQPIPKAPVNGIPQFSPWAMASDGLSPTSGSARKRVFNFPTT